MTDPIPARLAALKTMPLPDLKAEWRDPLRRRAAALQPPLPREPARLPHPGTRLRRAEAETTERLEALGEQYAERNITRRRIRDDARPIAGTRLLRE